jgi:hypothetical protein
VYANQGALNTSGTALLANITGSPKVTHQIGAGKAWLDKSNLSQPAGCNGQNPCTNPQLGNTGRNQFRGPGYWQNNFSLAKKFTMFREFASEIRIDAVQLTNTPQIANPNAGSGTIFTSSNFGQITSTLGSGQGTVNGIGGGRSLQGSLRVSF